MSPFKDTLGAHFQCNLFRPLSFFVSLPSVDPSFDCCFPLFPLSACAFLLLSHLHPLSVPFIPAAIYPLIQRKKEGSQHNYKYLAYEYFSLSLSDTGSQWQDEQKKKKKLGSAATLDSFQAWRIKMFMKKQEVTA